MAKRLIDWSLTGSILVMGRYIDADTPADELVKFNLKLLFPISENQEPYKDEKGKVIPWDGFSELTEVQQFIFVYGLKQKLADCGSAEKDPDEKAKLAKSKFDDFVKGKIVGLRANATGAKENKKLADTVKASSKVVSLEGLMMKKIAFPDTFTDEDQKKLDEFLEMVARSKKK